MKYTTGALKKNNLQFQKRCSMCRITLAFTAILCLAQVTLAEDKIELETITIKGNKELPKILYIVPWQKGNKGVKTEEQSLVLHSLFGDLFDPVLPEDTPDVQF